MEGEPVLIKRPDWRQVIVWFLINRIVVEVPGANVLESSTRACVSGFDNMNLSEEHGFAEEGKTVWRPIRRFKVVP